ncbi:hypothetical protein AHF37_04472 [Paragonimus kellicotti]|nr:hypothetical protein AHF37_04472 [Paragonimus kellicotti]
MSECCDVTPIAIHTPDINNWPKTQKSKVAMKFYKLLSIFIVTGITCLLVLLFFMLKPKRKSPGNLPEVIQWTEFDQKDAVHIAHLISGIGACNQFMVLLKTILHHMGRFNTTRCGVQPMVIQPNTCTNPNKVLVFHLILNTRDQTYLQTQMIDWKLPNVSVHFYNIAKYMVSVKT